LNIALKKVFFLFVIVRSKRIDRPRTVRADKWTWLSSKKQDRIKGAALWDFSIVLMKWW